MQALINGNAGRQGPPGDKGPPGPSGPSGPAGSSSSNDPNKWNASEIGFFDPHLDKSYGEGEVVTVGRDLYYRSVILFIERIKDLAQIKDVSMIRTNLNTCLRGFALEWYTSELRDLERIGLRADTNGVEAWCRTLKSRFKVRTNVALESLTSERYTLKDARNQREPAAYVQAVLRHAKNANIDSVENQLSFAYRGIAVELRAMIDSPSHRTTVADFIDHLDAKKDVWFDIHRALARTHQNQQRPQQRFVLPQQQGQFNVGLNRASGASGGYQAAGNSLLQRPQFPTSYQFRNAGFMQQPYQTHAYQAPQQQQQPRQIMPAPQGGYQNRPPQQTSGGQPFNKPGYQQQQQGNRNASGFRPLQTPRDTGPFRPNANANQPGFRRPLQPWQGQQQQGYQPKVPDYQATGDDIGEGSSKDLAPDENVDMSATSFNESFHQDESIYNGQDDYGNNYYYNEANDDQQGAEYINFVDAAIEAKCRNCNESFPSKTKLHKHLRTDCTKKSSTISSASKVLSMDAHPAAQYEPPLPSHPPIVESDARNDEVASGFAFRGWDYVKLDVRLEPDGKDGDSCGDTGCGLSLTDEDWLKQMLPEQPILKMASPVQVRGVGATKHNTDAYIILSIYIKGVKDGNTVLAKLKPREFHIVKNLRAHMLVGNDILGPEKITMDIGNRKAQIGSCGVTVDIEPRQRDQYKRNVNGIG